MTTARGQVAEVSQRLEKALEELKVARSSSSANEAALSELRAKYEKETAQLKETITAASLDAKHKNKQYEDRINTLKEDWTKSRAELDAAKQSIVRALQ